MTDEPKTASTWEECARHVEAGGVVEYLSSSDGVWMGDGLTANTYRSMTGAPRKGKWQSRRLLPILPIEDANPEGMTPGPEVDGRPTWYGTARDAKAAGMTEARGWTGDGWSGIGGRSAAAIIQARYPLPPKPKTVRVPWWEAVDREDPHDGVIWVAQKFAGSEPRVYFTGGGFMDVTAPDGTVEVLAEDGES